MNLIWFRDWNNSHNRSININTCQAVFSFHKQEGGKIAFSLLSIFLNVW